MSAEQPTEQLSITKNGLINYNNAVHVRTENHRLLSRLDIKAILNLPSTFHQCLANATPSNFIRALPGFESCTDQVSTFYERIQKQLTIVK
jgi:hypothetical protein